MDFCFSIIIPHRNTPQLLDRCLNSIPNRDDIQIIVIDDNSDKACLPLFAKDRKNLKYIFLEESHGAGYARNVGLKYSLATWVIFADADDFFTLGFNNILDRWKDSDADVIYFNANSVDTDYYVNSYRAYSLNRMISISLRNRELGENLLRYRFGEPWCKIIKRNILIDNHIKFDEVKVHNDTFFSLLVGFYGEKIEIEKHSGYCVTLRFNSLSRRSSVEKLKCRYLVFSRVNRFYKDNKIQFYDKREYLSLYQLLMEYGWKMFYSFLLEMKEEQKICHLSLFKLLLFFPEFLCARFLSVIKNIFVYIYFDRLKLS